MEGFDFFLILGGDRLEIRYFSNKVKNSPIILASELPILPPNGYYFLLSDQGSLSIKIMLLDGLNDLASRLKYEFTADDDAVRVSFHGEDLAVFDNPDPERNPIPVVFVSNLFGIHSVFLRKPHYPKIANAFARANAGGLLLTLEGVYNICQQQEGK